MKVKSNSEIKTYTILGDGGSKGNRLDQSLLAESKHVRLVSRRSFSMPGTETVKADLMSFPETVKAVKGSDVVFLCAGLPYNIDVWEDRWPRIMDHVIEACIKENALLIFFDNVYMYGKVDGKMIESTPYKPCSKKGEVRAKIALHLEEEMANKNIRAIIARAADLYGPHATQNSILYQLVIKNLLNSKKAQWMGDLNQPHTFTYTKDCAEALVLLANTSRATNQVWHLPSSNPGLTGNQWIKLVAGEVGADAKSFLLPKWSIKMAGLFSRMIAESYEMLYQMEYNYHFDSTKFETYFKFQPTSYEQGIRETLAYLKSGNL